MHAIRQWGIRLFYSILILLILNCITNFPFLNYQNTTKDNYNEYINREREKENRKKSYIAEKNKEKNQEQECFEMQKDYILNKEETYKIRKCH